jgi:hypothetical protein
MTSVHGTDDRDAAARRLLALKLRFAHIAEATGYSRRRIKGLAERMAGRPRTGGPLRSWRTILANDIRRQHAALIPAYAFFLEEHDPRQCFCLSALIRSIEAYEHDFAGLSRWQQPALLADDIHTILYGLFTKQLELYHCARCRHPALSVVPTDIHAAPAGADSCAACGSFRIKPAPSTHVERPHRPSFAHPGNAPAMFARATRTHAQTAQNQAV